MTRLVGVLTTGRWDYAILRPVLRALEVERDIGMAIRLVCLDALGVAVDQLAHADFAATQAAPEFGDRRECRRFRHGLSILPAGGSASRSIARRASSCSSNC